MHVPATMDLEAVKAKMMYDKHFVKKPTMGLPTKLGKLHTLPTAEGPSFMIEVRPRHTRTFFFCEKKRRDTCLSSFSHTHTLLPTCISFLF